jgi:phosphohistidine phosphatase
MVDCAGPKIDAALMRLMLLRHAKAEKAEGAMRDRDRALNARGRSDAAEIAVYMRGNALLPEQVVVSSARRTRETWECMAPEISTAAAVAYEDRLYDAGTETILDVIRAGGRRADALLVIGHNPGIHDTARRLLAGSAQALDEGLPTAGLVVIDFAENDWRKLAPKSGRLKVFATPRLIKTDKE